MWLEKQPVAFSSSNQKTLNELVSTSLLGLLRLPGSLSPWYIRSVVISSNISSQPTAFGGG